MFIRKSLLVATSVAALAGIAACDNANRTAETRTDTEAQQQPQDQVVREEVVGVETEGMEGEAVRKGEGEVQVEKEVTRRITSEEDVPTVMKGERKFDINRMDQEDFVALGFSESAAKNIIQYREQHNGFKSVDELNQVPGIDSSLLNNLRNRLGTSPARQ